MVLPSPGLTILDRYSSTDSTRVATGPGHPDPDPDEPTPPTPPGPDPGRVWAGWMEVPCFILLFRCRMDE